MYVPVTHLDSRGTLRMLPGAHGVHECRKVQGLPVVQMDVPEANNTTITDTPVTVRIAAVHRRRVDDAASSSCTAE